MCYSALCYRVGLMVRASQGVTVNIDRNDLLNALALYVLNKSEGGLNKDELLRAMNALSAEERLNALAIYQENKDSE
jgi:hypothetical protein